MAEDRAPPDLSVSPTDAIHNADPGPENPDDPQTPPIRKPQNTPAMQPNKNPEELLDYQPSQRENKSDSSIRTLIKDAMEEPGTQLAKDDTHALNTSDSVSYNKEKTSDNECTGEPSHKKFISESYVEAHQRESDYQIVDEKKSSSNMKEQTETKPDKSGQQTNDDQAPISDSDASESKSSASEYLSAEESLNKEKKSDSFQMVEKTTSGAIQINESISSSELTNQPKKKKKKKKKKSKKNSSNNDSENITNDSQILNQKNDNISDDAKPDTTNPQLPVQHSDENPLLNCDSKGNTTAQSSTSSNSDVKQSSVHGGSYADMVKNKSDHSEITSVRESGDSHDYDFRDRKSQITSENEKEDSKNKKGLLQKVGSHIKHGWDKVTGHGENKGEKNDIIIKLQNASFQSSILVTFNVLIHKNIFQSKNVYIVFGEPVGNWKTAMVLMKPISEKTPYDNLIHLFGCYAFEKKHCEKLIPYKYILADINLKNVSWEQFNEDPNGDFLNRYVQINSSINNFNKFDDCIAYKKRDTFTHTFGREKAFVVYCCNALNFQNKQFENVLEEISLIYSSQCNQCLVDKRLQIEKFGRHYRPDQSLKMFLDECMPKLGKATLESFDMAIFLTLFLSAWDISFGSQLKSLFETFKLMILEFINYDIFKMTDELKSKLSLACISLINQYISIISRNSWLPAYPCVYAYALARALQTSEDYTHLIKFGFIKRGLSENQKRDLREILKVIKELPESSPSFKYEYLHLCSPDLFIELISSHNLKLFPPTLIFRKLCHICSEKDLSSYKLKSHFDYLKVYFTTAIPFLDNAAILSWQEFIRKSLSSEMAQNHEFVRFYFDILTSLQKHVVAEQFAENEKLFEILTSMVIEILKTNYRSKNYSEAARAWSQYLNLFNVLEDKSFRDKIIAAFEEFIATWTPTRCEREIIPHLDSMELNESVLNILLDLIFDAKHGNTQKSLIDSIWDTITFETTTGMRHKGSLLSRLILTFPSYPEPNEILSVKMFLLVTESDNLFKILDHMEKYERYLSEKAFIHLPTILANLEFFVKLLEVGDISFKVLGHLENSNRANRLIKTFEACGKDIKYLIELRLEEFQYVCRNIDAIRNFFRYMEMNTKADLNIESIIKFDENNAILNDYCLVRKCDSKTASITPPKFILSTLDVGHLELMSTFIDYKQSRCFLQMLQDRIDQISTEKWTFNDALNFSRSIINNFLEFCRKLSDGSLLLLDVKKYFGKHYSIVFKLNDDLNQIEIFVKKGTDWPLDISKKIVLFFSVRDLTKMAETTKETIELIKVECDSSSLEKILELSDDSDDWLQNELNYLTDDLLKYKDLFTTWNCELLSAMKVFNKCANLIDWVRKNIENAQELKVFIDLANISAGESDIEVDRVLCFQAAVMAYSGLLFDCQGECTLDDLFQACNTINSALERDKEIAQKLLDSNRHIRWLESIKDRHGSVETSSLNLVHLISKNGEINIKATTSTTSSTCVDVYISFEEFHDSERYKQKLSLNALKELESKLMLISVSPEIKSQVDRFTSILHQIILVTKSFEQLLYSGCCLFSQLTITGYFSTDKEVSLRVDFGHKSGLLCGRGRLEEELSSMIVLLGGCVREWEDYIMTMRTDCHLLNFYTTDQLVILSHFMADIEFERNFDLQDLLMLLSLIAPDVNLESIKTTLKASLLSIRKQDKSLESFSNEEPSCTIDQNKAFQFDMDKVKEMLELVSESYGYEEENVLACILQTRNVTDVDEIVNWCLQNDSERATMEDFKIDEDPIDSGGVEGNMSGRVTNEAEKFSVIQDLISKVASDYDIEPENVFAAIIETGNIEDEEILAQWCYDNPDYKENISFDRLKKENFLVSKDESSVECGAVEADDVIVEMIEPPSSTTDISEEIQKMWSIFLSSSNVTDAEDFISFQRLGKILDLLHEKYSKAINRKFPPFLECGKPNLIVVKESSIHQTALMLYQLDEEKDLPSMDEILICEGDTTLEQLVLHCLRAFNDESGKIYIFTNADRINFDNSCHLEKLFLKPVNNHEYRLVFISSKEHDEHSYIANAMLRYRVNIPKLTDLKDIRSYLHRHLIRGVQSVGQQIDPGKSNFRIISSVRSGEGKSLVSRRMSEKAKCPRLTFSIHTDKVNTCEIVETLFRRSKFGTLQNIFHIDLLSNVREGVQDLLFSFAVIGGIRDFKGRFWKCSSNDYYAIEMVMNTEDDKCQDLFQSVLPVLWCRSPTDSLRYYQNNTSVTEVTAFHATANGLSHFMDNTTCLTEECQRPYQYLNLFYEGTSLEQFSYKEKQGNMASCLVVLLRACCVDNPTWMELSNFWKFLNVQLNSCEKSVFCNVKFVGDTLPGFKSFVVKFLIQMSKDFATRSAIISDESMSVPEIPDRNRWENSFHPYLFFNEDGHSLCFFGFKIKNCHLMDDRVVNDEKIISRSVMGKDLFEGLRHQGIDFNRNLHQMGQQNLRQFYLQELKKVFGLHEACECDSGYELTSDNVLKMLAIYMRFRADIPVMIMGETGTGKTRLIRFICDLQKQGKEAENMVIVKCHGGIESKHIHESVRKAIDLAKRNKQAGIPQTILFFDEANTTNAIGAIKEVMCDKMVNGEAIPDDVGLKFVAAVNPYREHSPEMIKKLENAGLGYHMKAENTEDKLAGKIPMRRLVYRVKELSPSILPLIWDFGTLDNVTEEKYIIQMVENRVRTKNWDRDYQALLVAVLNTCQEIMRNRNDECSFVSLRDVDRCLEILGWFIEKNSKDTAIISAIRANPTLLKHELIIPGDFVILLILAVACSYYVRLEDRRDFFTQLQAAFTQNGLHMVNNLLFTDIIRACQDLFINELRLESTISRNEALKENVWIMAICIELKIPLFLVGKPGSSKSLAKTLVGDVMQGEASYSPLFKKLKEIQLVSFQCSPLASAEGILSTFRQCQTYQKKQSLQSFTSVVVLDEIGLAEDSPKMPLKTLHPLLEDGCVGDEMPEDYKKVGFIGISNWALDPAKMNRGIFVSRGKLSRSDLLKTAQGICLDDEEMKHHLEKYLSDIVDAYLHIYETQEREYYGLRDFYSLIKMLYQFYRVNGEISDPNLKKAIYRCFGGYFGEINPATIFISQINAIPIDMRNNADIKHFELIKSAMTEGEENRYLLLLTKNNAALRILLENQDLFQQRVTLIFGSSFPHDQEYMQLCKSINRIKLAMEMGHTIILCNLTNLYESLYDALNQSYVYMGGSRYVDLGLGMHRVKCRVHRSFRLIVVAEDTDVFERFPIPLINRLEKHYLGMENLMEDESRDQQNALEQWIARFSEIRPGSNLMRDIVQYGPADAFLGFHKDVSSSLILQSKGERAFESAKRKLINCASPDSINRLESSSLSQEEIEEVINIYHLEQQHTSLAATINSLLKDKDKIFLQVTTHSRLLTISSKDDIASNVGINKERINLISLQQIETEEQFRGKLEEFFTRCSESFAENIVVIQCTFDARIQRSNLIECSRCCIKEISEQFSSKKFTLVLLIQIPRIKGGRFIGFPHNPWLCVHLDEIHADHLPFDIYQLKGMTVSQIFETMSEDVFCKLLLEACPKSCSAIKPIDNKRIVERIKIVSRSLKQSNLSSRISKSVRKIVLLAQKKYESEESVQQDFLVKVSMESIYLREGHTFQQSLWLTLLSKIGDSFTKIIKCCDLCQGLDHLTRETDWLQDFYLSVLEKLDIESQTPSELSFHYDCSLPFSWTIFNLFEKVFSTSQTSHSDTFYCAIKETELGSVLNNLLDKKESEVSTLFVEDLIAKNFPKLKSDNDLLIFVTNQIIHLAKNEILTERVNQLRENEIACDEKLSATDLYLAFNQKNNCLKTLCDALTFYERCFAKSLIAKDLLVSQEIEKVAIDKSLEALDPKNADLTTRSKDLLVNQEIEKVAIDKILEALDPKNTDLNNPSVRNCWMRNVKQLQIIVQKYLSYQNNVDEELVQKYRRLEVLSLFAEYVIDGQTHEKFNKKLKQSLNQLGLILKNSCDPTRNETFSKMIKILSRISTDTSKLIFCGGVDKCYICQEQMQEPVALPCQHVFCLDCLKETVSKRLSSSTDNKWNCPYKDCKSLYPSDFQLESSLECRETVEEHRLFRENMNVFFLEILQRFTFSGTATPDDDVIKTLLEYVVTKELPRHNEATRKLTPFSGDCIDSTPTIRSFIFQQILRGDWNRIEEFFQTFYESVSSLIENSSDIKGEFCLLLLYSIEDSLLSRERVSETHFISEIIDSISLEEDSETMTFLNKLLLAAKLRTCLSYAADLLHRKTAQREILSEFETIQLDRIQEVLLMYDKECLFTFLIKELADKHSRDSILEWKNQAEYLQMMHQSLRTTDFNYQPDYFSVIAGDYQQLKEQIYQHFTESLESSENVSFYQPPPQHSNQFMNMRLAVFYFKSKLDLTKPLDVKTHDCLSQIETDCGSSPSQLNVTTTMLEKIRSTTISAMDKTIHTLMFHLYELLLLHQSRPYSGVMNFFQCLCFTPNQLYGNYFPTMPQDEFADILELMHTPTAEHVTDLQKFKRVYKCSCGYLYGVADCGQLNQQGTCPECKARIGGGTSHATVSNFQDSTQTGHVLGVVNSNRMASNVRELSGVQVAIVRFVMHGAMLLSADKSALSPLVAPSVSIDDLNTFLMSHLRQNFIQLARALGKSEDHCRIYLHLTIDNFMQYHSNSALPLNAKDKRMQWEAEFSRNLPDIQQLDGRFETFQNQVAAESKGRKSVFQDILQNNDVSDFDMNQLPFVEQLWRPRIRVSLANINQKVSDQEMMRKCPLLTLMIQNEAELTLTRQLVPILKLQSLLLHKFNRKLDISDLENKTIDEFLLARFDDPMERESLRKLVAIYLNAFNALRPKLLQKGRLPFEHYKSVDAACGAATMEASRCGILFPSGFGFGLCAVALVQLLIDRHNDTLNEYLSRFKYEESFISPCIVDQSQLVAFEHHQLEMLLLVNSQYSVQSGRATEWSIDLDNLERQVENRFFVGRVLLDKKLAPQFQLFEDTQSVKKLPLHLTQVPLPASTQHLIESCMTSLPDVCLFLNHCVTLRNLLAITVTASSDINNVTAKSSLKSYVNMVQFRVASHLLGTRLLESILLEHMDDLIVFLKVVRAKRMILLKQNPWQGLLPPGMQETVDNALKKKLNVVLHHVPQSVLLSRLYRFIEECILSGIIDNGEFSISDCIYEYLEYELKDHHYAETFQSFFHEDALIKHSANCFAFFVDQIEMQSD